MRTATALTGLLIFLGIISLRGQAGASILAPRTGLALLDWSLYASPNLTRQPPPQKLVDAFVRSIEISARGESYIGEGEEVCSFAFANLRNDGFLSLVFGKGVTDRPSCRDVYIVDKVKSGFEMYWGGGEISDGNDVSANVRDLRHDGKLELLIGNRLGSIAQQCIANWTDIYAWTGDNYPHVSDHFKDYYRQTLETINQIIPALQDVRGPNGYALSDKQCLQAEAGDPEISGRFAGCGH